MSSKGSSGLVSSMLPKHLRYQCHPIARIVVRTYSMVTILIFLSLTFYRQYWNHRCHHNHQHNHNPLPSSSFAHIVDVIIVAIIIINIITTINHHNKGDNGLYSSHQNGRDYHVPSLSSLYHQELDDDDDHLTSSLSSYRRCLFSVLCIAVVSLFLISHQSKLCIAFASIDTSLSIAAHHWRRITVYGYLQLFVFKP